MLRAGLRFVWGDNSFGQTDVPVGLDSVVAIAAGGNPSLALNADGTVVGWGENTDSHGAVTGQAVPPSGLSNVVAIGAGEYHSLAVKADGTVVVWGDNSQGQGNVPPQLTNAVAVAGGGAHSLALSQDGSVTAWGANWSGQCDVPKGWVSAVGIAGGSQHSLLLLEGPQPVPRLLHPNLQGNRFSVLLQTLNRQSYVLERKESLADTNWTAIGTNAGNGSLKLLSDPAATAPSVFYRTRQ
jgi:hypothetical protein